MKVEIHELKLENGYSIFDMELYPCDGFFKITTTPYSNQLWDATYWYILKSNNLVLCLGGAKEVEASGIFKEE